MAISVSSPDRRDWLLTLHNGPSRILVHVAELGVLGRRNSQRVTPGDIPGADRAHIEADYKAAMTAAKRALVAEVDGLDEPRLASKLLEKKQTR